MSACEHCGQPADQGSFCLHCTRFEATFRLDIHTDGSAEYVRRAIVPRTEFRCGKCGVEVAPMTVLCGSCIERLGGATIDHPTPLIDEVGDRKMTA